VLPNYFYRDDALCIWSVLAKYVNNLLRIYYKSDEVSLTDILQPRFSEEHPLYIKLQNLAGLRLLPRGWAGAIYVPLCTAIQLLYLFSNCFL